VERRSEIRADLLPAPRRTRLVVCFIKIGGSKGAKNLAPSRGGDG